MDARMHFYLLRWRFLLLAAISSSSCLLAVTSPNVKEVTNGHNVYSDRKVWTNPFTASQDAESVSLQLTTPTGQTLPDAVRANLYGSKGLSSELELVTLSLKTAPTGRETGEFVLAYQTIPLCEYFIKAHRIGTTLFIGGEIPDETMQLPDSSLLWPSIKSVADWLQKTHPLATINTQPAQSCWWVSTTQPMAPAYEFHMREAGQPERVVAGSNTLFALENSSFSVNSTVTVQSYTRDPLDGRLEEDQVEVTDPTLLSNEYFTIDNGDYPQNTSTNGMFVYSPDDLIPFTEANVFGGVNRYRLWLQSIGYTWQGGQITIRLHQLVLGTPDNALFIPPQDAEATPIIEIGDGDGILLGSEAGGLPLDQDVVDHETTHSIIWRALKSTEMYEIEGQVVPASLLNHSLAIHEGLADTFPFLYQDDPCLAKSVCPATSSICYVPSKCLRTGDNDIQYNSDTYWSFGSDAHKKGMIVSGMVWDLRKMEFLPLTEFASFMNHSIDYLLQKSTYQDFLYAMLSADYELYNSTYCPEIISAAQARGFSDEVSTISCSNASSLASAKTARQEALLSTDLSGNGSTSTATTTTDASGSSKSNPLCGVATSDTSAPASSGLLYLLPLLFFIGKRIGI